MHGIETSSHSDKGGSHHRPKADECPVSARASRAKVQDPQVPVRRFVRALIRAGCAEQLESGAFGVIGVGKRVTLPAVEIRNLSARGLVCVAGRTCRPTSETGQWLRRQLSAKGDYAMQHRMLAPGPEGSRRNLGNNPLEKLSHGAGGGFLEAHHLEAGKRVCQWGERAQLRQRVTMSYDPAQVGGRRNGTVGADISEMAHEARKSLALLFSDLPRDCAEIIIDVCVFEKGLQTIETEHGWPRRSAKLVLRIGLEQLAQTLGLSPKAVGRPTTRLMSWLDDGFQPTRFE